MGIDARCWDGGSLPFRHDDKGSPDRSVQCPYVAEMQCLMAHAKDQLGGHHRGPTGRPGWWRPPRAQAPWYRSASGPADVEQDDSVGPAHRPQKEVQPADGEQVGRAGIEAPISHLKRGFRLRRLPGAQIWVRLGIFAYNLQRMTAVAVG